MFTSAGSCRLVRVAQEHKSKLNKMPNQENMHRIEMRILRKGAVLVGVLLNIGYCGRDGFGFDDRLSKPKAFRLLRQQHVTDSEYPLSC
jgi:hypothetical protein